MRIIDADELKKKLSFPEMDEAKMVFPFEYRELIDSMPTVDAVEVIRCIDCCHHEDEESGMVYCPNIVGGWVQNDFFCKDGSRGERK